MGYYITITMFCDEPGCGETYTDRQGMKLRETLRTKYGWGCILGEDGKKVDYCGRHWRALLEDQERNGYTLHQGEWVETAKLKQHGWKGLLDGGDVEGIAGQTLRGV